MEEEREAAVLFLDQIGVCRGGLVRVLDLEDLVPVRLVAVDAILRGGGEEDVDDGEDLIGAFEERLGLLC